MKPKLNYSELTRLHQKAIAKEILDINVMPGTEKYEEVVFDHSGISVTMSGKEYESAVFFALEREHGRVV